MANFVGTANNDTLTGTSAGDFLRGLGGNDKINGGLGFDIIRPGTGNDTLNGGPGDTANSLDYQDLSMGLTFVVASGKGTVKGAGKSDTFTGFILFAGTSGNDTFTSGALTSDGFYSFTPLRGDDRVIGNSSFDELRFEQNDIVRGINANLVTGKIIDGYGDTDTVSGIERLRCTRFVDVITGSNAAIERFQTYAGADIINGGGGIDELDYRREFDEEDLNGRTGSHGITIDMAAGTAIDSYGYRDRFSGIEEVRGTNFVDTMSGSNIKEQLRGEGGNDRLTGLGGDDVLIGDDGNDYLDGGLGADTLNGGVGNDTYVLGADTDRIIDSSGTDSVSSSIDRALDAVGLTMIENLSLRGSAVVGRGNSVDNKISGNGADNRLYGLDGNDTLNGVTGDDFLVGGRGKDIFVFNTAINGAASNIDRIVDFSVADDTIQLDDAIFKVGALTSTKTISTAAFYIGVAAHDSNDRIIYDKTSGALYYDSNGNAAGGQFQFATLSANLALTIADFVVF